MRVLVAPQEFKGSLAADEAAIAIASGLRAAHPEWKFDNLPLSDGGPGLLDAMRRAVKADTMAAVAHDALGRKVLARYVRIRATGEIVIEAAQANGLLHVKPHEYDPLGADTFGVGELILDAARQEPARMIIGVGGSATNDGGEGMARALGAKFYDMAGRELLHGGGSLGELEQITWERPRELDRNRNCGRDGCDQPPVRPERRRPRVRAAEGRHAGAGGPARSGTLPLRAGAPAALRR